MKNGVNHGCGGPFLLGELRICFRPSFPKKVKTAALTFGTRPVTSGHGSCFVKKKQFGVVAGFHNHTFPASEFKHTNDPASKLKLAPDLLAIVMKASAIAHKRSAFRCRDQVAERCYAVLEGHMLLLF
jgi:hypothetical protein